LEGSHTLEKFVNEVAKDVDDPEAKISAWKRDQSVRIAYGSPDDRRNARSGDDLRIGALGSGSDFTPFLQHLGVAALNIGYGGEDNGGIYHSIYDDFYWFTHFSDTSFVYGRALAQTVGLTTMRLASADLLPFAFTNLASTVHTYVHELQQLRDTRADEIAERTKQVEEGIAQATSDPREPTRPLAAEPPAPHLAFAELQNAADALTTASARYEKAYTKGLDRSGVTMASSGGSNEATLRAANMKLVQSERALTAPDGLPKRPWFTHLLYAPGYYTGYGVKTMPGAREAIEQSRWSEAEQQLARVAAAVNREAAHVNDVAALLEQGPKPSITP
jgi:N-acetylated-alpha-linked acidic dipeptidase